MTGYEITSRQIRWILVGWRAGNLDAQNYGPAVPLSADFNNTNSVDAADYAFGGTPLDPTPKGMQTETVYPTKSTTASGGSNTVKTSRRVNRGRP